MLYLSHSCGSILSILHPELLCRSFSQSISSLHLGIWWEPVQTGYKNWWYSVIKEKKSFFFFFLCVEVGNPKVRVPQGQLKAMMLGKKMESEVNPVFHFYLPTVFFFCVGIYDLCFPPSLVFYTVKLFWSCHKWNK